MHFYGTVCHFSWKKTRVNAFNECKEFSQVYEWQYIKSAIDFDVLKLKLFLKLIDSVKNLQRVQYWRNLEIL